MPDKQTHRLPSLRPGWARIGIAGLILSIAACGQPSESLTDDTTGTTSVAVTSTIDVTTTIARASVPTSVAPATTRPPVTPRFPQSDVILAPPTIGPAGDPGMELPPGAVRAAVVSITDGDTLQVELDDGSTAAVRLIGINSPESSECFADEASLALGSLAPPGSRVGLTVDVSDRDRFDRLLRYLWVGGMSVNEELVRRGAALARRYPPDTALADRFTTAQTAARVSGIGLWAPDACGPRADASLSIVDVRFDAPGDDSLNLNEEWVRIRNDGTGPIDLSGWGIKDESAGNRYWFPDGFTLASGEEVTVHSGCGTVFDTSLFWCATGSAIWNNDGDTVFLVDPSGNIHTFEEYSGDSGSAAAPVTPVQRLAGDSCDPSYPGVCIPPAPPDLDCGQISFRRFEVVPPDPHRFDGNHDGVGCES